MTEMFLRAYMLEDCRILSRAEGAEFADGRTVEAYAAVFDIETEIQDSEGHYLEVIDRAAFNRAIEHARPAGGRLSWRTKVFYNHGMTLYGTPSERFSVPLGATVDLRAEERGLLTVTRYNNTPLADEILESIRNGEITGQSFSGRKVRSHPLRAPRNGFRRAAGGKLPTVRRLELGLNEYGPTPIPAYHDAAIVGVRSMLAQLIPHPDLPSVTRHGDDSADDGTSADADLAPDDTPSDAEEHSSRDALLRRIAAARSARPDLFPVED